MLIINGEKVYLELRHCANKGCERVFYTTKASNQSICSELCWQVATQKNWIREALPPVKKAKKGFKKKFRMFSIKPEKSLRPSDHAKKAKKPQKPK